MKEQSEISFILDDELYQLDIANSGLSPTTTVHEFLHNLPHHQTTRQACAYGDCGACTVVLGQIQNGRLTYKPYNSCMMFLPLLHGKQLITIENLSEHTGGFLAQQAISENLPAECGNCKPGFIMSLFALYKNKHSITQQDVDDAFSGNICLCTNFKPSHEVFEDLFHAEEDKFVENEDFIYQHLKKINDKKSDFYIETERQKYYVPLQLPDAIEFLSDNPHAAIVNGGTQMAPKVSKKRILLREILDISKLQELKTIQKNDGEMSIGAALTLEELLESISENIPGTYNLIKETSPPQIRNQSSLGGNVASPSFTGDLLPVLLARNASIEMIGPGTKQFISLPDYIWQQKENPHKQSYLVTKIKIPELIPLEHVYTGKSAERSRFVLKRITGAARLHLKNEQINKACFFFGGRSLPVFRSYFLEEYVEGKYLHDLDPEIINQLLEKELKNQGSNIQMISFLKDVFNQIIKKSRISQPVLTN